MLPYPTLRKFRKQRFGFFLILLLLGTLSAKAQLTVSASGTNITCYGSSDGTASASPSGGTPGYTYLWSPVGGTSASAVGLTASAGGTTYMVTVTDAVMATATASVTLVSPTAVTLAISSSNVSCFGGNNGSATVTALGGTAGYTYSWSTIPPQTTAAATSLSTGTYTVTVTDGNACTATSSVSISQPSSPVTVSTTATGATCPGMANGSATASTGGGTAPYVYQWMTGSTASTAVGLSAGIYTVTVTDAINCSATAAATVTQPPTIILSATVNNATCGMSDGLAAATASGGTPGYSYNWNTVPTQTTATATGLSAGSYTVTVSDNNACTETIATTIIQNCVYPGDANDDYTANNIDLFNIGFGYGATGPVRSGASLSWVPQSASDWGNNFSGGVNYKHADCNGDGIINDDDTLALHLNYGLTHSKTAGASSTSGVYPELLLTAIPVTADTNTVIAVDVTVGSAAQPVTNLYGAALTVHYNQALVRQNVPVVFDYSGSFLGTKGADLLTLDTNMFTSGRMDISLVRNDQTGVSGYGKLLSFFIVTTDNLSGIQDLVFTISGDTLVTHLEGGITHGAVGDTVHISPGINTGIADVSEVVHVNVYPNPFSGAALVSYHVPNASDVRIEVYNLLGEKIRTLVNSYQPAGNHTVSVGNLLNGQAQGVYFLKANIGGSITSMKLMNIK